MYSFKQKIPDSQGVEQWYDVL